MTCSSRWSSTPGSRPRTRTSPGTSTPWRAISSTSWSAAIPTSSPHGDATTPDEVEASWETLKRVEKGRTSAVDGVPLAQPALALAAKLMARAEKSGLAVPVPDALSEGLPDRPLAADEVGALLLAVVARARADGVDAELALRTAARGYAGAVRAAEARG